MTGAVPWVTYDPDAEHLEDRLWQCVQGDTALHLRTYALARNGNDTIDFEFDASPVPSPAYCSIDNASLAMAMGKMPTPLLMILAALLYVE